MSRAIPIGSFATRTEAEIVIGLLESEGIAASISTDDAGGTYPFEFAGGARVLVDESDAKAAREALARRTET
jgi:Putative prokaryotic signal transducing protein